MEKDAPIAIIGLAYRAPGVGRKGLYEFLAEAKSAWSKMPVDRVDHEAYYSKESRRGCFTTEGAHFLPDDIYGFDAAFFNMKAEEAQNSDPQHRMMLECALEAAESAGQSLLDLAGKRIGVFLGCGGSEYAQRVAEDPYSISNFAATGVASCMAANRISYFFDLRGPSVVLDAACASSVYAAHQACQALRNGECDAAFLGGAELCLSPGLWIMLDKMGALSPDGRSYSYDQKAAGFGRGEGAACLLVKRIDDAIRDGDPIHAIIRSSACNHSGRSKGITMPSRIAQENLLWEVHEKVGLNPSNTPVVEGHGTGTQAGDPIEAGAFASVLAKERTASNPLYIGSIKSNFGHLEGASGILGIIKAIVMLKKSEILPNAGFENFNSKIESKEKLRVAKVSIPWPENEPKRVLVTNFGFGGSNAAIVLEAAVSPSRHVNGIDMSADTNGTSITNNSNGATGGTCGKMKGTDGVTTAESPGRKLFVFSAKTEKSLTSYLSSFQEYLDGASESSDFLNDLSYTLGQRRTHHPYRVSVTADSMACLKEKLPRARPSKIHDQIIAFVFTGQGAQYAQMASGIWHLKAFADAINQAEAHLKAIGASWSLTTELAKPKPQSRINDAEISQPACTAIQLALVILLKSWGLSPTKVMGHSSGEIAAAFTAGLISFRAAVAIAYFRGQAAAQLVRHQTLRGGMLALGMSFEAATEFIRQHANGYATVAAINSLQSVTVSGDRTAIESIHKVADAEGFFARRLNVEVAYHSRHMDAVADTYLAAIETFCDESILSINQDCSRPVFVSSVTGCIVTSATLDAFYWVKNLVQPVRFVDAIVNVLRPQDGNAGKSLPVLILEVGPHAALKNPIMQMIGLTKSHQNKTSFTYVSTLVRGTDDDEVLLDLGGRTFSIGLPINLGAVNQTKIHDAHVLTDLPAYAWNKSSYEHRTRATREFLHPGEPYNPLLGRKTPTTSGNGHAYRQVFNLDDIPWIRDHKVAGNIVFPMTGYLSNAIEAIRRTVSTPPAAVVIRDCHITRGLEIEEEEIVDMMTKIRPAFTGTKDFSSTTWSFDVSTWTEANGWTTHCHGQIELETNEMTIETPTLKESLPLITTENMKEYDVRHEYETAGARGTVFGPAFQSAVKLSEGKGFTVLETELRDLDRSLPNPYGSCVCVDPPTLDGFLQGGSPLQKIDGKKPAQMPNFISRLRVSNRIPDDPRQRFTVVTRLLDYDVKGGRLHLSLAGFVQGLDSSLAPIFEIESITFRTISTEEAEDPASRLPDNWCWDLLPAWDFLPPKELTKKLSVGKLNATGAENLNKAAIYYIACALKETAGDDRSQLPLHLSRFIGWASRVVAREGLDLSGDQTELLEDVYTHGAQGELLCKIGEQLVPILRGEVQPLEIMLKDGLLARHYEADMNNKYFSKVLGEWVLHLSDLEPDLRILEIGGGTAGTTYHVLKALSRDREEPAMLNFTFTDISAGFFENARIKLAQWSQRITYKKLDISQDPMQQGFSHQDYDLIIAANVLHATPDMADTMANVRSLLKPKGKLLLLEANRHPAPTLPFALLPGWWYAMDKYRDHEEGPLLTVDKWNSLLLDTGFSGIDAAIQDRPGSPEQMLSVMCSTRIGKQTEIQQMTVCGPFVDDEEINFAQLVAKTMSECLNCQVHAKPVAEINPADDSYCVFIDSPRHSFLTNISINAFQILKSFLLHTRGLLWVVPGGGVPEAYSIKGMLATIRLESEPKNLLWLDNVPWTSEGASAIMKIARKLQDSEVTSGEDQEYIWHQGSIHLPRLRQMKEVKEQFAAEQGVPIRRVRNIWEGNEALEMTVDAAGSPDSMYFRRSEVLSQATGDNEIVVKTEAAGVNSRDLLIILGIIPWTRPGFEGVGTVFKIGSHVRDFKPGDRICYALMGGGCFATYLKMPSWCAFKIPELVDNADAASIPIAYTTAYMALMRNARLRMGESVLIHAASGAVGQACIVLATHMKARIFVTAGSRTKREFLHQTFGIPQAQIFSSRTPEFRDAIMCATKSKGIDVIVNSLSGTLLQETWTLIADFGRFVEIGKRNFLANRYLAMRPFDRNVTFFGIDLRAYFEKRPEELKECMTEVVDMFRQKVIVPICPVTAVPISQFATGLRKLQSGQNLGKIVVTLGEDECVLAESLPAPTPMKLNPDATYLISGGTRGIGLSLAYWMIENGAHSLVVIGRSGASGSEVRKLLEKYEGSKVRVMALACDVSSRTEVDNALRSIQDLPPVRGVIHSALFLHDAFFENATYDDWQKITGPRVRGAWNLHELLPNLDFFIALSSFLGDTGNIGQSIYGGTATFYDAFAKYRNSRGHNTVSVALPVVVDVGYVADRDLTEKLKNRTGCHHNNG